MLGALRDVFAVAALGAVRGAPQRNNARLSPLDSYRIDATLLDPVSAAVQCGTIDSGAPGIRASALRVSCVAR